MHRFATVTVLAACTVGSILPAQDPPLVRISEGASFQFAVMGQFLGYHRPCAIVVRGGLATLVVDPGRMACEVPLAGVWGITGIASYRRPDTPLGDGDVVVLATTGGLVYGSYVQGGDTIQFTSFADAAWMGADRLAARVMPNGSAVIAGRSADHHHVLLAEHGEGDLKASPPTFSTNEITFLQWLDWGANIDPGEHPVVTTVAGVGYLVDQGQLSLSTFGNLTTTYTFPLSSAGQRQLGMLTPIPVYPQLSGLWIDPSYQAVLRDDVPSSGLSVPGQLPTGAATCDLDGDGIDEILISRRGEFRYWFLSSTGTVIVRDILPGATGASQNNTCPFFWTNFVGGPEPDLLAFLNAGIMENGVTKKAIVIQSAMVPIVDGGTPSLGATSIVEGAYGEPETSPPRLHLVLGNTYNAPGRKVQVTLWHQNNPYDGLLVNSGYTNAPAADQQALSTVAVPLEDPTEIVLTLGPPAPGTPRDHYYLDLIVYGANGETIHSEIDGYGPVPGLVDVGVLGDWEQYLLHLPRAPGSADSILLGVPPGAGTPRGGQVIGGIIRMVIPRFPEGEIPKTTG